MLCFCQQNYSMFAQNESVVLHAFQTILQQTWAGVAVQNIKKMAPQAARLEGLEVLQSHVTNELSNREIQQKFYCEHEPSPSPIDPFAVGFTEVEKSEHPRPDRKQSIGNVSSKTRTRKFTASSFFDKKHNETRRSEFDEKRQKNKEIIELVLPPNAHEVHDPEEQAIRQALFKNQKYEADMKKLLSDQIKLKEQSSKESNKLFKDVKKFTFDFSGKVVSVGSLNLGVEKTNKLDKRDGAQDVVKKEVKNPESSVIQNEKLKERGKKGHHQDKNEFFFDENRPQSLLDLIKDDNSISEGVKFTADKGTEKLVKQRQRKLRSGFKKYRLNEFQGLPKQTKFKEFRSKALDSLDISINKTSPLDNTTLSKPLVQSKQLSVRKRQQSQSNSQSQQILKIEKSNKIPLMYLPPLGRRMIQRGALSSRTIDVGASDSRVSERSKITVGHEDLYEVNFRRVKMGEGDI